MKLGKPDGTTKLAILLPGPGTVVLSGPRVQKETGLAKKAGTVTLPAKPRRPLAAVLLRWHR